MYRPRLGGLFELAAVALDRVAVAQPDVDLAEATQQAIDDKVGTYVARLEHQGA